MLAGTCFTENIGRWMKKYRFDIMLNPHGILYNPLSLATSLQRALENKKYQEGDLFFHNELYSSWEHHGHFSNPEKEGCLSAINNSLAGANLYLQTSRWLIVTFGSAWVYRLKTSGQIVGNCHKYPNKEFDKELLSPTQVVNTWQQLIADIKKVNPAINIIFTVSPVRYIRDGAAENNLSKAILLQAVHTLCKPQENIFYFPAYELVMDDLRDYRFFEADNVHPNQLAIEYVWEKFIGAAFDEETAHIYQQLKLLIAAAEHRAFYPTTQAHKKFLSAHYEKAEELQKQYPFLDLADISARFKSKPNLIY